VQADELAVYAARMQTNLLTPRDELEGSSNAARFLFVYEGWAMTMSLDWSATRTCRTAAKPTIRRALLVCTFHPALMEDLLAARGAAADVRSAASSAIIDVLLLSLRCYVLLLLIRPPLLDVLRHHCTVCTSNRALRVPDSVAFGSEKVLFVQ
jgi:hypothetical protein